MMRTNMPKRAGRGRYTRYLAHYTRKNYALLALGGLFVLGVLLGTLLVRSAENDVLVLLVRMVNGFVEKRQDQGMVQNFASAATSSLVFVGILLICGFCAVAQPAELLAPLFRGLGYGFSISTLYAQYGLEAMRFVALFILPNMLLSTIAVLFCCRESLRLSTSFLAAAVPGGDREPYSLRIYLARYFAAGIFCLISALLEAVFYVAFANFSILG